MGSKKKAPGGSEAGTTRRLRRLDEAFEERHFDAESASNPKSVALMYLGATALGAASYVTFFWSAGSESPSYVPYLFALGIVCLALYIFTGQSSVAVVVVGDFGVRFVQADSERSLLWPDVERMTLEAEALVIRSPSDTLALSTRLYPTAIHYLLQQGRLRIEKRVEAEDEDIQNLAAANDDVMRVEEAELPQVTSLKCRASGRLLSVEQDARICGRCGALYHRQNVPKRCVACGKKLRNA